MQKKISIISTLAVIARLAFAASVAAISFVYEEQGNFTVPIDPLVQTIATSATLEAQWFFANRIEAGLETFNWGLGASPFEVPPEIQQELSKHTDKHQYVTAHGIPELNRAIASHYSVDNYHIPEGNVLIATGLKQLIFDVQRAFGGEIIHVVPFWVSYQEQTKLLGKTPLQIFTNEVNDYKLMPEEIIEACKSDPLKPRLLIFNNPVNPTGAAYTENELTRLAWAIQQFNIIVFADEVYMGLEHDGHGGTTLASYLPQRVIRASSLSKKHSAGGWRLGWATFPAELTGLKNAMAAVGSSSYSCAPVPEQYAALPAFAETPAMEEYLALTNRVLGAVGDHYAGSFQKLGITLPDPEAAWYLWVNFEAHRELLLARGVTGSAQLTTTLLAEAGFLGVAGVNFGMPESDLHMRLSFVDFDGDAAVADLKAMGGVGVAISGAKVEAWTPKLARSLVALTEWLALPNLNSAVTMSSFLDAANPEMLATVKGSVDALFAAEKAA